ncbi:hypothetical protein HIO71_14200 [Chryseobacterium aquaticum]|uniref:MarR family transcriptional regulator n=1 Tax=Chryseobacterium aquaticum TaxID=452084 RepID=A0A848N8R4_9FLAO|nr:MULTISPECIES: hypothetical protein [Chryseobacterium]NMR35335.1 hypothetical protein [Chryseobacterium aquaticum]NRQ47227.1 hypothetical protein [Chryseobacterium sp. C-204]
MNEKLKIKGNKIKVFEKYWENDDVSVIMILLVLHYSISGKTLSVQLKKIAFILDAVKKNLSVSKLSTLLSSPWQISDGMRKMVIIAFEKGFLDIKETNSVISFSLTTKGSALVEKIEKDKILPDLSSNIRVWSKAVSNNELKNQRLIW